MFHAVTAEATGRDGERAFPPTRRAPPGTRRVPRAAEHDGRGLPDFPACTRDDLC
jgi:hypothetical protein